MHGKTKIAKAAFKINPNKMPTIRPKLVNIKNLSIKLGSILAHPSK